MATQDDTGFKAFTAGEALAAYRCVRFDSSANLVYADDEEEVLGVTQHDCASGDLCTIKLLSAPGTFKIMASTTVTFATTDERGAVLCVDNDGKVSGTGTNQKFAALEGCDPAGVIECVVVHNAVNATA